MTGFSNFEMFSQWVRLWRLIMIALGRLIIIIWGVLIKLLHLLYYNFKCLNGEDKEPGCQNGGQPLSLNSNSPVYLYSWTPFNWIVWPDSCQVTKIYEKTYMYIS